MWLRLSLVTVTLQLLTELALVQGDYILPVRRVSNCGKEKLRARQLLPGARYGGLTGSQTRKLSRRLLDLSEMIANNTNISKYGVFVSHAGSRGAQTTSLSSIASD